MNKELQLKRQKSLILVTEFHPLGDLEIMSDFSGILYISLLKHASHFTYHHTIGYLPKTTQIMDSNEKKSKKLV